MINLLIKIYIQWFSKMEEKSEEEGRVKRTTGRKLEVRNKIS